MKSIIAIALIIWMIFEIAAQVLYIGSEPPERTPKRALYSIVCWVIIAGMVSYVAWA